MAEGADYCLEVLQIGELLLKHGLKEEVLRKIESEVAGGAHLVIEMKPQFMNIWWWLLGTGIMIKHTRVLAAIDSLWPAIIDDWKRTSDFEHPDDIVVLMNLLLADTYLGILSASGSAHKPLRRALTAADDLRLQHLLLKAITVVDANFLRDVRATTGCSLSPTEKKEREQTPWMSFSPVNDPTHVDVRMIYTSLLAWTLLRLRREEAADVEYIRSIFAAPAPYFRQYVLPSAIPIDGLRIGGRVLSGEQVRQGLVAMLYECRCPEKDVLGGTPYGEPHAGYIFCVANSLYLLAEPHEVRSTLIGNTEQWLRQRMPHGDRTLCCGRPGKGGDVCYCFWVQGALHGLAALQDREFEMSDQIREALQLIRNKDDQSFGKSAGAPPDIFHTFFGNLALSRDLFPFFGAPVF